MLSKLLERSINTAFSRAKERRHEFITVEHLLLALLDNPEATEVLLACGADIERLRQNLSLFIDETTPCIPPELSRDTQPTLGFQRVLQRAIFQVQSTGQSIEVTGANVLAAIFNEHESQAVYFLSQENINRIDILHQISSSFPRKTQGGALGDQAGAPLSDEQAIAEAGKETALERYTTNLNELAKAGKIDPLIGREQELQRAIQVLCRRRKNNPLFVGEAGVGKTAMAEGLARFIVENKVPEAVADSVVYAMDLGLLLAGTKYRGDFEKRFKAVLEDLKTAPGAIVFIDEIHTIIGAGAASGGTVDASNLIKPMLASGDIRCIGSTTYTEYRNIFEKDSALTRRFQKIDLKETTPEQTLSILKGLKRRFEEYHDVKFSMDALKSAVDLADRYITDRAMPDKAIDVMDEAGAYQRLQPPSKRKKIIGQREVEDVIANMTQIPSKNISASEKTVMQSLERDLKMLIFGQDQAIDALTAAIKLSRSGLREANKPVGSFLFSGPTGVGKTEVSLQLAKILGVELIRFDMSEYMESHAVARLIGAPPGYVGYDQGGLLTEEIVRHPHSVLLLDEIEKAHPDIFNILLQVMDHASLTDNNGRIADFQNVILVMTTNAGAEQMERRGMGFAPEMHELDSLEVIKRIFSPEFRNRLDAVIQFHHLDFETVGLVVTKLLMELEVQLDAQGVTFEVDQGARAWLAKHGYNRTMGARPLARLIQEVIKRPLADELLFGKLQKGGHVRLTEQNDKIVFAYSDKKDKVLGSSENGELKEM